MTSNKIKHPRKLMKRVLFHQDIAPAHKFLVSMTAGLLCMMVTFNWLITLHILLIWPHLAIICYLTRKKHLVGNQYSSDDELIYAVDFFYQ